MNKYALVYDIVWRVYRCEPSGQRYEIAHVNKFEDAVSAARYDHGGPIIVKVDVLETE